jgi:hypothetical protein
VNTTAATTKSTISLGQPRSTNWLVTATTAAAPAGQSSQPEPVISSAIRKTPPIAIQAQNGWAKKKACA